MVLNHVCYFNLLHVCTALQSPLRVTRLIHLRRRNFVTIESFGLLNISRLGELLPHQAHTVNRQDNKNKFARDGGVER